MKWLQLTENAIEPTRATKNSAGYDFYASDSIVIKPNEVAIVPTDISFGGMNTDQYLQLSLPSGVSIKRPVLMANSPGIVDSDYAGKPIGVILFNRSLKHNVLIDKGTKIAQGILLKYYTTEDEVVPLVERTGGFGSTEK
jgi:dUTP pyrophosphatase